MLTVVWVYDYALNLFALYFIGWSVLFVRLYAIRVLLVTGFCLVGGLYWCFFTVGFWLLFCVGVCGCLLSVWVFVVLVLGWFEVCTCDFVLLMVVCFVLLLWLVILGCSVCVVLFVRTGTCFGFCVLLAHCVDVLFVFAVLVFCCILYWLLLAWFVLYLLSVVYIWLIVWLVFGWLLVGGRYFVVCYAACYFCCLLLCLGF